MKTPAQRKIRLLVAGLLLWGTLGTADETPPVESEAAPAQETPAEAAAPGGATEEVMDLGAESADTFAPYNNERNPLWALLPVAAISIVLVHLRKSKPAQAKLRAKT